MRQVTGTGIPGIRLTIAISVVVHVALFGAAQWLPEPPHVQPSRPVTIELVPPAPSPAPATTPLDVVLLDPPEAAVPAAPTDTRDTRATATPASAAVATSTDPRTDPHIETAPPSAPTEAASGSVTLAPGTSPEGPRSPYLDMRRAPRAHRFVRDRWDDLEHVPAGTAPAPDLTSGTLAPDGGGRHRSDQGAFVAKVDKDGSVKLRDKRNFNIHLALPSAKDIGDLISDWYYDPNKPVGTLGPPHQAQRRTDLTRGDVSGAERLYGDDTGALAYEKDPHPGDGGGGIPIAAGGFDLTDAFMRGRGVDPYASKKLAFLDSTRDERAQIGARYKREQLAQVAQIVTKNLAAVWAATQDVQQRKQALFEMWDECVETGGEEEVRAAATARTLIVGFIRANVPATGPHAYTTAELAACNRVKRSAATFAPYTDP